MPRWAWPVVLLCVLGILVGTFLVDRGNVYDAVDTVARENGADNRDNARHNCDLVAESMSKVRDGILEVFVDVPPGTNARLDHLRENLGDLPTQCVGARLVVPPAPTSPR